MSQFLILGISFLMGYIVNKAQKVERSQISLLNSFILYVSLPSQIFLLIPTMDFKSELFAPISVSWIIFIISFGFIKLIGNYFKFTPNTIVCLIMVCGLGNTSFVGLPLIENYYGKDGVGIGIYVDQFGTFLSLSLIGIPFLLSRTGDSYSAPFILKRIFLFPPFVAIVIALIMKVFSIIAPYPDVLKRLGDTLAPIALFSIGAQLRFREIRGRFKELVLGLTYKLFIAPIIIFIIFIYILDMKNIIGRVSVFEASMGPMITSTILTSEKNIEPELASILLALGIILSFPGSYLWYIILKNI